MRGHDQHVSRANAASRGGGAIGLVEKVQPARVFLRGFRVTGHLQNAAHQLPRTIGGHFIFEDSGDKKGWETGEFIERERRIHAGGFGHAGRLCADTRIRE